MSSREAKGMIHGPRRRPFEVEVEARDDGDTVRLEISKGARDSSGDLAVTFRLEQARELLRGLQRACDRADREAYRRGKEREELEALHQVLDAVDQHEEGGT